MDLKCPLTASPQWDLTSSSLPYVQVHLAHNTAHLPLSFSSFRFPLSHSFSETQAPVSPIYNITSCRLSVCLPRLQCPTVPSESHQRTFQERVNEHFLPKLISYPAKLLR